MPLLLLLLVLLVPGATGATSTIGTIGITSTIGIIIIGASGVGFDIFVSWRIRRRIRFCCCTFGTSGV
jgi:hypothetical protein